MVWSCLEENDLCTNESEFIEVGGTKKGIGRPKITLIEEVKNDISIKKVTKRITLDRIE
jgi:hypothetical protein